MSSLEVTVLSATNLPNVETFSKSDPYAIVEFQGMLFSGWIESWLMRKLYI